MSDKNWYKNDCPICNCYAHRANELCDAHKPTWEIKEVVIFGRHTGWAIFSDKYMDGLHPIHINISEEACRDFFFDKVNQYKMAQALIDQNAVILK